MGNIWKNIYIYPSVVANSYLLLNIYWAAYLSFHAFQQVYFNNNFEVWYKDIKNMVFSLKYQDIFILTS